MPERTVGVGLISVGWMGRAHSRAYRATREHYPDLPARPRLLIAADVAEAGRRYATELLGYDKSTADYREVLARPDVDVVSICAPNFLHREMALAAAEAGKPFWIEKPMGRGLAESDDIARAASRAGLVTAVSFSYRHPPAVAHARALIRAGRLGAVTNVRVSFLAGYSADPAGALTWRFERDKAGSGVLGDLLSHGFDLAAHLVGQIAEVSATDGTYITERPRIAGTSVGHTATGTGAPGPVENEDYAAILARFASGAIGIFESSRIAVGPLAEYVIDVYGTEGSLRWDFQRMNELKVAFRGDRDCGYTTVHASPEHGDFGRFQPGAGLGMGFDDLKTVEAALFLRSVSEGIQHGPSAADGRGAAAIVDAAERSSRERRWVAPEPPSSESVGSSAK
jgi:predicted dehydrogenase